MKVLDRTKTPSTNGHRPRLFRRLLIISYWLCFYVVKNWLCPPQSTETLTIIKMYLHMRIWHTLCRRATIKQQECRPFWLDSISIKNSKHWNAIVWDFIEETYNLDKINSTNGFDSVLSNRQQTLTENIGRSQTNNDFDYVWFCWVIQQKCFWFNGQGRTFWQIGKNESWEPTKENGMLPF